jgi:predicted permease
MVQVGCSLVLITGAMLFTQSYWTARSLDLGFEPEGVLVTQVNLRNLGYDEDQGRAFVRQALERLAELPGAGPVSAASMIPFSGAWSTDIEASPGSVPNAPDNRIWVGLNTVAPAYFDVAGVEIISGRPLGPQDVEGAAPTIVINEVLAGLLWPGQDPIGKTAPVGDGFTVVGVARHATYYEIGEQRSTQAYLPVLQQHQAVVHFLVKADHDVTTLSTRVQSELREIEPSLAFSLVTTFEALVDEEVSRYEVSAVLVSLLSVIAVLLAATGLYGVVAFLVTNQTREIGVRMALGANQTRVAGEVVLSGLRLAVGGLGLGVTGAVILRGHTESLLFNVEAGDPLPMLGACLILLFAIAAASAGPARRATRLDPIEAMGRVS